MNYISVKKRERGKQDPFVRLRVRMKLEARIIIFCLFERSTCSSTVGWQRVEEQPKISLTRAAEDFLHVFFMTSNQRKLARISSSLKMLFACVCVDFKLTPSETEA